MMDIVRLGSADTDLARDTFAMMAVVFEDLDHRPLHAPYLARLLTRPDLWLYAAVAEGRPIGGLTAHALPMTRTESTELLMYDLAIRSDWQRRGVGRAMIARLLKDGAAAGVSEMWVPADDEDAQALEFYRRTGGQAQPVTIFTYPTTNARP